MKLSLAVAASDRDRHAPNWMQPVGQRLLRDWRAQWRATAVAVANVPAWSALTCFPCRYEGITQKLSWTGSALRSFGGAGPYHRSRGERER